MENSAGRRGEEHAIRWFSKSLWSPKCRFGGWTWALRCARRVRHLLLEPTSPQTGGVTKKILATRPVFPSLCHRRLMLSPGDFLVGRGAVASSHHFKPTFYRSADPVHVSPCFGAPSCFVCLAEVALSQDEVGSFRIGAAPGEGDEGPKTQRVDMTKAYIYSMTQLPRHKAATLMRVGSSADMLILVDFPG